MSYNDSESDEDGMDEEDGSIMEGLEGSMDDSSSSESVVDDESDADNYNDIDVDDHKADVLLNIHDQLDLDKLQKMKRFFIADDDMSGAYAELDMKQFSDALRSVLPDAEELADEDLGLLFMKIDANGSGDVDWDEFTGFLLQLDEGNRNMKAAADMVDLKPLPGGSLGGGGAGGHSGQHRDMIEKVINVERPGVSAYVTCGRDGAIKFWHKGTFVLYRTIRHLDTMKAAYEIMIMGGKGREVEGNGRRVCLAPVNRAVKSMKSAWVYDIQQMPLSNRIAAACFDRTVSFYDILTGEFVCRIGGLRSSPTCVDCIEIGSNQQQVIFGDLDGLLHVWSFGKHFYIPGLQDTREAAELNGNYSMPLHAGGVSCVGYVADLNTTVTCGMDGKIHFFDLVKRRVTRTFMGHLDRPVFAFAYSKRHRFVVSAGMGRSVVFWNSYTMNVLARRDGHAASVRHCLVDDDSDRVITISADKAVRCWDSATFRCIQSFRDHRMHRPDDTITAALWDHSRTSLVVAGNRLGVWKNKGAIQSTKQTHEAPVTAALYNSHFHQVVSGDAMGNVHVWLIETGLLAFRFGRAHGTSKISCMSFDASERRLLTGANDGTVKLWNFNNGKELRLFVSGSSAGGGSVAKQNEGNERNEVSGVVYCRDGKRSEQEGLDYVATCSWDKHVRVFAMERGHHNSNHPPLAAQPIQQHQSLDGGEATNVTVASRVFPEEYRPLRHQQHHQHKQQHRGGIRGKSRGNRSGGSRKDGHCGEGGGDDVAGDTDLRDPVEGHSADILAIAHCGHQQVATAGFDGRIFVWAADSGKAKFSMKPSDHDVSKLDEVSSIGGLTSVARLMMKQRREKGRIQNNDSDEESRGYLDRMESLLAEDASICHVSWDGRQYFAEERMGGSEDGSGTGQAANVATDPNPEDGSAAEADQTAAIAPAAATSADKVTGAETTSAGEMPTIPENKAAPSFGGSSRTADADEGRGDTGDTGAERRQGGVLSSPDQTVADGPSPGGAEQAAATPVHEGARTLAAPTVSRWASVIGAVSTGGSGGLLPPSARQVHEDGEVSPEAAVVEEQSESVGSRLPQQEGNKKGAAGEERTGVEGAGVGGGDLRSEGGKASKKADASQQKDEDGVDKLLESAVSHTVDCLIFIRCHNVLCSGTASGELHFWDAPTGGFIFGVAARHPNNPGLTAMSSNEGPVEGSGGSNPNSSEGLGKGGSGGDGGGGGGGSGLGCNGGRGSDGGTGAAAAAASSAAPGATGSSANLMLFTACEEGFVKTWRVGDISEHTYETGVRARPKPPRKARSGRGGKGQAAVGETGAPPRLGEPPGITPAAHPTMQQISSLLQPVHQWQAHKATVTSVDGGNFRGRLDLLVTAGDDCYVHVWTIAGSHVGTFGQPTAWSLGSRATWREPTDQALCSAYDHDGMERKEDESSSTTTVATTEGEQESAATPQGGSKLLRRTVSKLVEQASTTASGGGSGDREDEPRKGRKREGARRPRISQDRDLEKEREEMERYQEKRFYLASQSRVQRKLLRGRLSAFCVSRDYYKKESIQEATEILNETGRKSSPNNQPSNARPVLSKQRIASILRHTYNQVSFQLQLHKHEDVHERAEVALTRRKSRRRAKALSSAGAGHHHRPSLHSHNHGGGTPQTNDPFGMPSTAGGKSTPRTISRTTGSGGGGGGGGGGESGGRATPEATKSSDIASKDHEGGARPAVPTDPQSSSAASGRRFRRTSTVVQ